MLVSISLASNSAVITVANYAWYKYTLKRKQTFDEAHKEYILELNADDVFGIRKAGSVYHLIMKQYPEFKFKLTQEQVDKLVTGSVGWKGKIKGVVVSAGIGGKDPKVKPVVKPVGSENIKPPRTSNSGGEDKELTAKLKKLRIKGFDQIKFLHKESFLPNEITYYYDISAVYTAYAASKGFDKKPKTWGDEIEALVEKSMPDLDIECGTVNYLGKPLKLMSVLELET